MDESPSNLGWKNLLGTLKEAELGNEIGWCAVAKAGFGWWVGRIVYIAV